MVDLEGIEPPHPGCRPSVLPLSLQALVDHGRGIEPRSSRFAGVRFCRSASRGHCVALAAGLEPAAFRFVAGRSGSTELREQIMERVIGVEPTLFRFGRPAPYRLGDTRVQTLSVVKERGSRGRNRTRRHSALETEPAPSPHGYLG